MERPQSNLGKIQKTSAVRGEFLVLKIWLGSVRLPICWGSENIMEKLYDFFYVECCKPMKKQPFHIFCATRAHQPFCTLAFFIKSWFITEFRIENIQSQCETSPLTKLYISSPWLDFKPEGFAEIETCFKTNESMCVSMFADGYIVHFLHKHRSIRKYFSLALQLTFK